MSALGFGVEVISVVYMMSIYAACIRVTVTSIFWLMLLQEAPVLGKPSIIPPDNTG